VYFKGKEAKEKQFGGPLVKAKNWEKPNLDSGQRVCKKKGRKNRGGKSQKVLGSHDRVGGLKEKKR